MNAPHPIGQSNDWQVGDLALCVDATWFDCFGGYSDGPAIGSVHAVTDITIAPEGFACLDLEGWGELGMDASQFRKIRPDEHEACEEEFRILLKLSKQRVVA